MLAMTHQGNLPLNFPIYFCQPGWNRKFLLHYVFSVHRQVHSSSVIWKKVSTAKSLQSCPTLSDPIDGSPPGSPVPGILQARVLEWGAIAFSPQKYLFCLFWMGPVPDCPWPYTPGFWPFSRAPFTKMFLGHATLTPTLVGSQVTHGIHGVPLIIFVLNTHESCLSRVFLIDYKSHKELEKWRQLMKKQCERCFAS